MPTRATETATKKTTRSPRGERQSIQVISRAAAILRALERNPDGLSLGEIAKAVDLSRSTVQRIVDALDRENLVLAATASGVRLGPALLRLAAATRYKIREVARETMEALSRETGETVDLAIADNEKVVFVDQVAGTHRLTAVSAVGGAFPLHCSANGKAVLSTFDEARLQKLRKRMTLTKQTKNTITTWPALERELQRIRESGIAFDREENSIGISAIAVALHGPLGDVASISMPVPTQRFVESEAALVRAMLAHATALQRRLEP